MKLLPHGMDNFTENGTMISKTSINSRTREFMQKLIMSLVLFFQFLAQASYANASTQSALFLEKEKSSIAKAINYLKEKQAEEERKAKAAQAAINGQGQTTNSVYDLQGEISQSTRWVMVRVSKINSQQQEEVVLLPANNKKFQGSIPLKNGAGVYKLGIFTTDREDAYGGTYAYHSVLHVENLDQRDMSYLLPSSSVQSNHPSIIALAKELTKNSRNEAEIIKDIHDFVVATISYDNESYADGSFKFKSYDALSILKTNKAVCSGYSNLLAALLRAANIRTRIVYGVAIFEDNRSEEHAWNEVFLDNMWMPIDSTWNVTYGDKYFLTPKEEFEVDHKNGRVMDFF